MARYWLTWTLVSFTAFAIPELTALATGHPENTLSVYVWRKFNVIAHQPISQWSFDHFAFAGILALTAIWLVGHLAWGLWR